MHQTTLNINWRGPFGWPLFNEDLPALPETPGVYLFTVDHGNGFLVYAAGITRRPLKKRFTEHSRSYLSGTYNVLDIVAMRQGIRREIWHGSFSKKQSPERLRELELRKIEIQEAAKKQLNGFRIFAADIGVEVRIPERIEGAVMAALYAAPKPFSDVPDRGMLLMPRWNSETPILAFNICHQVLHCISPVFEI